MAGDSETPLGAEGLSPTTTRNEILPKNSELGEGPPEQMTQLSHAQTSDLQTLRNKK